MSINIPATALTALAAVLLVVILFGILAYAECMFARKESFVAGLILPGIFFCMSLVSVVGSLPSVFVQAATLGISGLLQLVLVYFITFVFMNLPTAVTYIVYYRERKKLGETPWPFNRKNNS